MLHAHARIGRREPVREVAGAVGRAVVDDEQHGAGERVEDRRRDARQVVGLVVGRQDHPGARAQRGLRRLRARSRGWSPPVSGALGLASSCGLRRHAGVSVRVGPRAQDTTRIRQRRPVQAAAACRGRRSGPSPRRGPPARTLNEATYEPSVRRVAVTTYGGPAGLLERDRRLRAERLDRRERHPQRLAGLQPRGRRRRGERARPDRPDEDRRPQRRRRPSGAPRTGPAAAKRAVREPAVPRPRRAPACWAFPSTRSGRAPRTRRTGGASSSRRG